MTYLLLAILLYVGYRFVTGFVLPVARTTNDMRRQFETMKNRMEEAQRSQQPTPPPQAETSGAKKGKYDIEGEYISFEEVKENR